VLLYNAPDGVHFRTQVVNVRWLRRWRKARSFFCLPSRARIFSREQRFLMKMLKDDAKHGAPRAILPCEFARRRIAISLSKYRVSENKLRTLRVNNVISVKKEIEPPDRASVQQNTLYEPIDPSTLPTEDTCYGSLLEFDGSFSPFYPPSPSIVPSYAPPPLPVEEDVKPKLEAETSSTPVPELDNLLYEFDDILINAQQTGIVIGERYMRTRQPRANIASTDTGDAVRIISEINSVAQKRSQHNKIIKTLIQKMRDFVVCSGDYNNTERHPYEPCLFLTGPAVTEKLRRCQWLCHGFIGCKAPEMMWLIEQVCRLVPSERNGAKVVGFEVCIANIQQFGGGDWAPTRYKGSNGVRCNNFFNVARREYDFAISCVQVVVDEERAKRFTKIDERLLMRPIDFAHYVDPAELLYLRNRDALDPNLGNLGPRWVPGESALQQPVNYIFKRGNMALPPRWAMYNARDVLRSHRSRSKFSAVLRRTREKVRRAMYPFLQRRTVPLPLKRRGRFFVVDGGRTVRVINTPQPGSTVHRTRQNDKFNTILNSMRRLAVEIDCPMIAAFVRNRKLIIFHHGELSDMWRMLAAGYSQFVLDTGIIPRASLGVRQHDILVPAGPFVRSSGTFYFSTLEYLNHGRKHCTSDEQLVTPWPARKYRPGTEFECETVYDRHVPTLEMCGPHLPLTYDPYTL